MEVFVMGDFANEVKSALLKKGIRVDNSIIPVISLQSLTNLFQRNTVAQAFEAIKRKSYLGLSIYQSAIFR